MTGQAQSAGKERLSAGKERLSAGKERLSAGNERLSAGIDIGTTAVKAVAVDEDGNVVWRTRVASALSVGPGDRLEHDAVSTWWEAPRAALRALAKGLEVPGPGNQGGQEVGQRLEAVAVSAMMPSVAPVDERGRPIGAGLLYGSAGPAGPGDPTSSDEMARLAALAASDWPGASGYWPAQGIANASLGGQGVIDLASAFAAGSLFNGAGWEERASQAVGLSAAQLPRVVVWGEALGELGSLGGERSRAQAVLGAGSVDGLCEQLVAGVSAPGDVLITLGSTLVVWLCVPGWPEEVPAGLWRVPHLAGGMALVGGASNAGGLWADWADRVLRPAPEGSRAGGLSPDGVPLWWPWARGERVPWHDASLRVGLSGGHLSHGSAHLRRAAFEATGFVVRHIVGLASACGTVPRRYVVTGGGVVNQEWLRALCEVLGAPVLPMAVPEGAALGAAFLARMAAGLETSLADAGRWSRWAAPVEPRPEWAEAAGERYERWAEGLPARGPAPGS
ncbi:MAG: FGGY-family carbohydrate kinase [Actinomycetota bacterium]|jgi:xylulokinase|nr:FGGY-family carbohydrate kinase [Actinomycetota bacterium]